MRYLLILLTTCFLHAGDIQVVNGWSPQKDKKYHFCAGAIVGTWAYAIAKGNDWKHPWVYGVLGAFLAGLAKEAYDLSRRGMFDPADLVYTTAGGGSVTLVYEIRF